MWLGQNLNPVNSIFKCISDEHFERQRICIIIILIIVVVIVLVCYMHAHRIIRVFITVEIPRKPRVTLAMYRLCGGWRDGTKVVIPGVLSPAPSLIWKRCIDLIH